MKMAQTVYLGAALYNIIVWHLSPIGSPFFRVFDNDSSLDPLDITGPVTSLSISHLQLHSWYYSYDPSRMSQFHLPLGQICRHTLNKGGLSPPYSSSPVPPANVLVSILSHIFYYPPHVSR